jgi:hypothetical protein
MGRYAAGCSGAAGDTSCELRPWSTSGVEVEPVRPEDRAQLWIDADLAKVGPVAEWLAHRVPKIAGEVDDSFAAVIEDQTELVASRGSTVVTATMRQMLGRRVESGQLFVRAGQVSVNAESAAADRSSCRRKCGRKCGLRVHT